MKDNQQHYKKIALITCYLGRVPWYFNLFLKSIAKNENIDFIFVSNQPCYKKIPENCKWIFMTNSKVESLIKEKLDLKVNLEYAYKLCDLKPAYGVIFEDYLSSYDFWGHCDIDLIFGQIRNFMTEEILSTHDVICVNKHYVTGFFTLFRNNYLVNHLFEHSKDFKFVFEDQKHHCFDECNNLFSGLTKGISIFELESEIESMTHVVKKLQDEKIINAYFDGHVVESTPGKLSWDNGTLIFANKYEALLYHLIDYKQKQNDFCSFKNNVPNKYYIEEFYFSKYSPDTFIGKLYEKYISLNKKIITLASIIKYRCISSNNIKETESLPSLENFDGIYHYPRLKPRSAAKIFYMRNRFYIELPFKKGKYLLKHIKENIFYCSKYHLELKFSYSKELDKLSIDSRNLYTDKKSRIYKYSENIQ